MSNAIVIDWTKMILEPFGNMYKKARNILIKLFKLNTLTVESCDKDLNEYKGFFLRDSANKCNGKTATFDKKAQTRRIFLLCCQTVDFRTELNIYPEFVLYFELWSSSRREGWVLAQMYWRCQCGRKFFDSPQTHKR